MATENREEKANLWLYPNKYRQNERHPAKTGTGEIPSDVLTKLVERSKSEGGDKIAIQCAAWERVSKNGNPYLFITIETEPRKAATSLDPGMPESDIPF